MTTELHLSNIALYKYIWQQHNTFTSTEKSVMMGIFIHRNVHSFDCHPNLDTIVRNTGCGRSTVQRTIKRLEQKGSLIRVPTHVNGKTGRTFYFAVFDMDEAKRISEYDESVFAKAGNSDIFDVAVALYAKIPPF